MGNEEIYNMAFVRVYLMARLDGWMDGLYLRSGLEITNMFMNDRFIFVRGDIQDTSRKQHYRSFVRCPL